MTSVYNALREACGISQAEAAEYVHETRLDTVKSWSSDRRPAPQWAINQLQSLLRRIRRAGEEYAAQIRRAADHDTFFIGHAHDDRDARACGFPSTAAQNQAIAIAISLLPDDAEIRLVPRIRGEIPAPILEKDIVYPTATDRQVLAEMPFEDGKCLSSGNINRRKYERLEDIGWVKGIGVNVSDVEYHLTLAGYLQLALLATAHEAESDVPSGVRGGFQSMVISVPQRRKYPLLKPGTSLTTTRGPMTVISVDGDVVKVKLGSGAEAILSAPKVLLPA